MNDVDGKGVSVGVGVGVGVGEREAGEAVGEGVTAVEALAAKTRPARVWGEKTDTNVNPNKGLV